MPDIMDCLIHLLNIHSGKRDPEVPRQLIADAVGPDSATIYWTVTSIAFTPETYVVHYGTSMDRLDSMSDVNTSTNFTAQNYKFSIQLNGLTPNTMYFYVVHSTNSNGTVFSQIANFTTESRGMLLYTS